MLKVMIATEGNTIGLRVIGHAGYAEIGKDIVCSSASILAYTVAQIVMEAGKRKHLTAPPKIRLDAGDTLVVCEPKRKWLDAMRGAYYFAKIGYELLAHNYPQNVELITDVEAL